MELTIENVIENLALIAHEFEKEFKDVYSGVVEYIEKFGYEPDDLINESLNVLEEYLRENYEEEESIEVSNLEITEPTEIITETQREDNTLINQIDTIKESISPKGEMDSKEISVRYEIYGDHRVEEKVSIIKELHKLVGFPVTQSGIEQYKGEFGNGMNQVVKMLLENTETSYSKSTVYNLVQTVLGIDNSLSN